eukprot:3445415-Amphidinium_carterae.1
MEYAGNCSFKCAAGFLSDGHFTCNKGVRATAANHKLGQTQRTLQANKKTFCPSPPTGPLLQ